MALKSFVEDARKTNQKMEALAQAKVGSASTIIDISEGQSIPNEKLEEFRSKQTTGLPSSAKESFRAIPNSSPKTDFEKQYLARSRAVPQNNSTRQQINDNHCNIVANVIKQSGTNTRGDTTWECCKYKKDANGTVYCTEYHSLCGKERCKRATK